MEWISVKDRFPINDHYCLGYLRNEMFPAIVSWDGKYFTIKGDREGALKPNIVTHWMPLPKTPTKT